LHQGLLRYKGRIWVGNDTVLQHKIIEALHDSPVGGGNLVFQHRTNASKAYLHGLASKLLFTSLCILVQPANKPSRTELSTLVFSSHYLFFPWLGKAFPWTLSKACRHLLETIAFWWLLTVSPNTVISFPCTIRSQHCRLQSCS
jgi:hypothetical protein